MTIETIIDHDQPDFEPGNPGTRAAVRHAAQVAERLRRAERPWVEHAMEKWTAAVDEAIHALFPMPLRTARTRFLLGVLEQAATTVRSWNHERSHADF
jgi:hypothetical protein